MPFIKIAETNDLFTDFGPYVASINNKGVVSFQAATEKGHSGIFKGDGFSIDTVADTGEGLFQTFYSHPDIDDNTNESFCFYAELKNGTQGVYSISDKNFVTLADTCSEIKSIGPLGPTMNDEGAVAFRAELISSESGIFAGKKGSVLNIADTKNLFNCFFGIPVINAEGTVVFRASLKNNSQGIFTGNGITVETIVGTGDIFSEIGLFPCINDSGTVIFNAVHRKIGAGIFTIYKDVLTNIINTNSLFESFRGALINNSSGIIFIATPANGKLGIFKGPDPISDKIISVGDLLFDSEITEFAINPVSMNDYRQIAIRLKLANNKQLIVRADLNS